MQRTGTRQGRGAKERAHRRNRSGASASIGWKNRRHRHRRRRCVRSHMATGISLARHSPTFRQPSLIQLFHIPSWSLSVVRPTDQARRTRTKHADQPPRQRTSIAKWEPRRSDERVKKGEKCGGRGEKEKKKEKRRLSRDKAKRYEEKRGMIETAEGQGTERERERTNCGEREKEQLDACKVPSCSDGIEQLASMYQRFRVTTRLLTSCAGMRRHERLEFILPQSCNISLVLSIFQYKPRQNK